MTDARGRSGLRGLGFRVVVVAALGGVACGPGSPGGDGGTSFESLRGEGPLNIVLVTLDTLRADRTGPYGFEGVDTPVLDRLAAGGVLFERAYSPTPLTLPAHSSLMTGTYPGFHGVRDNGAFVIPPDLDTLAKRFHAADYATAAFVGAFVLDSRWGLSGDFDTYFDDFTLPHEQVIGLGSVQRSGGEVVDQALDWLGASSTTRPFFLWVHLYDAHTPYTPPEPYRSRYAGRPYLGEIAYVDAQVGRLLAGLSDEQRARTVIAVAADHGEGLGDHGEIEHGFFVYEEAIHIPMIVATPYAELDGIRRTELVSLVDLMPTLLQIAGLPVPATVQGESLMPLLSDREVPWSDAVYSESFYPRLHFGWSELKTVRTDRYRFIRSPEPELYDLQTDPGESTNRADELNTAFADLSRRLDALDAERAEGATTTRSIEMDDETRARLAALGYISVFADDLETDADELPNPRDKIEVYNQLLRAKQLKLRGKPDEAITELEGIVAVDPGVIDAQVTLGVLYSQVGRQEDAIATYETALGFKPGDLSLVLLLVGANTKLGRIERALQVIEDFEDLLPEDPRLFYTRGNLHRFLDATDEAVADYRRSLALNPDSAAAWTALAGVLITRRSFDEAGSAVDRALRIDPETADAHFVKGQLQQHAGDLAGAEASYLRELEVSPEHLRAAYNLSIIYREMGREPEEEKYLRRAMEINPQFPLSPLYLARLYMLHNQSLDTAIQMAEWATQQKLAKPDLAFAYFLLADLYNRVGQPQRAREYLRRGTVLRRELLGEH